MSCYPVDSADARDRAEAARNDQRAEDDPLDWRSHGRRIPMPSDVAEQIRRTLAEKRKQRAATQKAE